MAEYLAPGVYVEETSFRAKSIEGVGTSTAAFVGPALRGPVVTDPDLAEQAPELLTSFGDFERIYGGFDALSIGGASVVNHTALAVQAFFNNGGSRLYFSRVDQPGATNAVGGAAPLRFQTRWPTAAAAPSITLRRFELPIGAGALSRAPVGTVVRNGTAPPANVVSTDLNTLTLQSGDAFTVIANRGAVRMERTATITGSPAELVLTLTAPLTVFDLDIAVNGAAAVTVNFAGATYADVATAILAVAGTAVETDEPNNRVIVRTTRSGNSAALTLSNPTGGVTPSALAAAGGGNVADLAAVTAAEIALQFAGQSTITVGATEPLTLGTALTGPMASLTVSGDPAALGRFGLTAGTTTGAAALHVRQSNGTWSPALPGGASAEDTVVVSLTAVVDGFGDALVYDDLGIDPSHANFYGVALAASPAQRGAWLTQPVAWMATATNAAAIYTALAAAGGPTGMRIALSGGAAGGAPVTGNYALALRSLLRRDDISIVAAPGSTAFADTPAEAANIQDAVVQHVATGRGGRPTYRIAVLDTPDHLTPGGAAAFKARFDDTRAALYYPWIVTPNPLATTGAPGVPRELATPPSGFIAGVYARTDVNRGVFKAPANEVVFGASRFAYPVNEAEQSMLNPLGVNCLRTLPNRGNRVWGARTTTSDPEWKYVPVRRYFLYLEASIERGTQWAVFEPNGERLWANIRETLDAFLFNEWKNGALLGASPKEAYFVKCDRSTMSQNDLDNGRLVCLIGVAPLRPAEFVIFRIGQKTADARD